MNNPETNVVSSGVDALIGRLRDEGVASGRSEAEKIVAEAQARADWMLKQAKEEADKLLEKAQTQAEHERSAGEEALKVAFRDTVLGMKDRFTQRFAGDVQRLVSYELKDEDLLKKLILEIAGRVREQVDNAEKVEILLPQDVVGLAELRRNPAELEEGTLTHFVLALAADALREGVNFSVADDKEGGIRVQLTDSGVNVDLTNRAFADLLLQHLQPRFRALLEGAVK